MTVGVMLVLASLVGVVSVGEAALPARNGRIAFVSDPSYHVRPQSCGDIFTVSPTGADRTRLTHGCPWVYSEPAYGASGHRIVFVRGHESFPRDLHGAGIYVMDADGSRVRRITDSKFDEEPAISPNGRWIVFDRFKERSETTQLFIAASDGSHLRQLTHGQGASDPTFSPNGKEIAFVGPSFAIYTMRLDGSHVRQITHGFPAPGRAYGDPDFSPNGRRIVFTCGGGDLAVSSPICIIRADGSHLKRLTPTGASRLYATDPVFSPSGREVAFLGEVSCDGHDCGNHHVFLYTVRADGRHARQIYDLGPNQELGSLGLSWQALR